MGLRVDRQQLKAKDIAAALAARIEPLAFQLLGEPTQRNGREWRWGQHYSLSVVMRGDKAGSYFDHEQAQGGDALDLIAHVQRTDIKGALAWARDWLGGSVVEIPTRTKADTPKQDDTADRMRRAAAIWNEARDPAGTPVELYLKSRGLQLIECPDLRFHPECPRGADRVPAMVALMRDAKTCGARAIHRTYLTIDGQKAKRTPDDPAKEMLGAAGGAAIMLSPSADVSTGLFITEGIENGIASILGGWSPAWALGSAGAVAKFPVLAGVETLSIIADADQAGRRAARECADRWLAADREVQMIEPRTEKADWNDVFRGVA